MQVQHEQSNCHEKERRKRYGQEANAKLVEVFAIRESHCFFQSKLVDDMKEINKVASV